MPSPGTVCPAANVVAVPLLPSSLLLLLPSPPAFCWNLSSAPPPSRNASPPAVAPAAVAHPAASAAAASPLMTDGFREYRRAVRSAESTTRSHYSMCYADRCWGCDRSVGALWVRCLSLAACEHCSIDWFGTEISEVRRKSTMAKHEEQIEELFRYLPCPLQFLPRPAAAASSA